MSICRAVIWTSVCHAGLSLSLTPTLRLLKQALCHSSGPIQYDSPLYGQCGPSFSALGLFVLCVYRRFMIPIGFRNPSLTPHLLHKPRGLILVMPQLLSIRLKRRRAALSNYLVIHRYLVPFGKTCGFPVW